MGCFNGYSPAQYAGMIGVDLTWAERKMNELSEYINDAEWLALAADLQALHQRFKKLHHDMETKKK